jgi:hypothetical protein
MYLNTTASSAPCKSITPCPYQSNTRNARSVFHRLPPFMLLHVDRHLAGILRVERAPALIVPPSKQPARSLRLHALRAERGPAAGSRVPAARHNATISGRRSSSTPRRLCDLHPLPRARAAAHPRLRARSLHVGPPPPPLEHRSDPA